METYIAKRVLGKMLRYAVEDLCNLQGRKAGRLKKEMNIQDRKELESLIRFFNSDNRVLDNLAKFATGYSGAWFARKALKKAGINV